MNDQNDAPKVPITPPTPEPTPLFVTPNPATPPQPNAAPPSVNVPGANGVPPPKKSKLGLILGLSIGGVALICTLFVVFAILGFVGNIKSQLDSATNPSNTQDDTQVYILGQRPGWNAYKEFVQKTYKDTMAAGDTDEIWKMIPKSREGIAYYEQYMTILGDRKTALIFDDLTSTNPDELDAKIEADTASLKELIRKFQAQEDLGVKISIKRRDGTTYTSDGTNASKGQITDLKSGLARSIETAEAEGKAFQPYKGADGTYVDAAIEFAGKFGLLVDWEFNNSIIKCGHNALLSQNQTGGVFCSATPEKIYLNQGVDNFANSIRNPGFLDLVKHEVVHSLIYRQCGTSSPKIVGKLTEGVTNSYGQLYLGISSAYTTFGASVNEAYAVNDTTVGIAKAIHDDKKCN